MLTAAHPVTSPIVWSAIRRSWPALTALAAVTALVAGCGAADIAAPAQAARYSTASGPIRIPYGEAPDNFGDLYLPGGGDNLPVVVMIHGGGWGQTHDLTYTGPLATDLTREGIAVWNIEYRRVGGAGGWPVTLTDVVAATDALVSEVQHHAEGRLDLDRVHVTGHSAGGQLAAWIAARATTSDPAAPGERPHVPVRSVTTMAGVLDMRRAADAGDQFVRNLLGGIPDGLPDRYHWASPITHLPFGVPVTALHGTEDRTVSPEQPRHFADAARSHGEHVEVIMLPGVGHGDFGRVDSSAWQATRAVLVERVTRADD
ncbi:alpha/beta hydrolase [Rhodococcus triatomae]|uniref:Prolyl oligopeptidase family protein n=1 Tax=Rhodococcus triatomae TaxID=300028 RepID=A0A1G8IE45_9NOCA|nr:alpha/beta hydrolase [Rhodococcus triatomae]QNG23057.1 alpha/beta hydrolase [Rhodococcus triatomae]SDI17077.1 Prolyl oligopeptidase family protein [Rhodococcus triatomae]